MKIFIEKEIHITDLIVEEPNSIEIYLDSLSVGFYKKDNVYIIKEQKCDLDEKEGSIFMSFLEQFTDIYWIDFENCCKIWIKNQPSKLHLKFQQKDN